MIKSVCIISSVVNCLVNTYNILSSYLEENNYKTAEVSITDGLVKFTLETIDECITNISSTITELINKLYYLEDVAISKDKLREVEDINYVIKCLNEAQEYVNKNLFYPTKKVKELEPLLTEVENTAEYLRNLNVMIYDYLADIGSYVESLTGSTETALDFIADILKISVEKSKVEAILFGFIRVITL